MKLIYPAALLLAFSFSCSTGEKLYHQKVSEVKSSYIQTENILEKTPLHPLLAIDDNEESIWEADTGKKDNHAWIEINFESSIQFDEVKLLPGKYNPQVFHEKDRIKSATWYFDNTSIQSTFDDDMQPKYIRFGKEVESKFLKLVVNDFYPGIAVHRIRISEIQLYLHKRKIELNTDDIKRKIDESIAFAWENFPISPPNGLVVLDNGIGESGGPNKVFFFDDHTYVETQDTYLANDIDSRIIGKWELIDDKTIRVYSRIVYFLKGKGKKVFIPTMYQYYSDYQYMTAKIIEDNLIDWKELFLSIARERLLLGDEQNFGKMIKKVTAQDEQIKHEASIEEIQKRIATLKSHYLMGIQKFTPQDVGE